MTQWMDSTWNRVIDNIPREGKPVLTIIADENGARNEAVLKRGGNLWFFEDGSMYVYYTPTHWKDIS